MDKCVICYHNPFDPQASFTTTDEVGQDVFIMVCAACVERYGHLRIVWTYLTRGEEG